MLNPFNLVEQSHLFVYFTLLTSYYLGLFTSITYFDFSASKIRKSDQNCLFSRIDGRQNVQQKFCMLHSVSRWRFKSSKVTSGEIMAKNGLFRILTAVEMCKKPCSQKSFDLKISPNVKSASKSLNLKFQKI